MRRKRQKAATIEVARAAEGSFCPSSIVLEMPDDFRQRTPGRSAAAFDKAASSFAHPPHAIGIAQQFNPRDSGIFGAFDLQRRAGSGKSRGNLRKILHRRTEHGNLTEGGRLQDVVTSGGNKRASHKSAV